MSTRTQEITTAQMTALGALLDSWQRDGEPRSSEMRTRTATDLGVTSGAMHALVRKGFVATKSEITNNWGETILYSYRFTPRGRVYARELRSIGRI